jgi:phage antirepressor YoqD-like protein
MTPNIIQTAKQTVKAHVLTSRTETLSDLDIRTPKIKFADRYAEPHYARRAAAVKVRCLGNPRALRTGAS